MFTVNLTATEPRKIPTDDGPVKVGWVAIDADLADDAAPVRIFRALADLQIADAVLEPEPAEVPEFWALYVPYSVAALLAYNGGDLGGYEVPSSF